METIYEDELVKNMTMEICYEVTNTNPNTISIPINVCLEGHNRYELCVSIDSGYFVYFRKRSLFLEFMWKKFKNPVKVWIVDNSIMSHSEAIEGLFIEIGKVQCIIPIYKLLINPLMK